MRIHRIFEEIKDTLYAVAYDDVKTNILNVLQENWSDPIWLDDFFEANKSDLQSGFYGSISIEDAVEKTIYEADDLFIELKDNDGQNLSQLFRPLDDRVYQTQDFQEQKVTGSEHKSWLRIYAVHFYDQYVITGGAIKLTKTMNDRDHTIIELKKMQVVRDSLRLNESDGLFVYLEV